MADGSVIIGVTLDTAAFAGSVAMLQGQLTGLAANISQSLSNAFSGVTIDASLVAAIANLSAGVLAASGSVEAALQSVALAATTAFVASGGWAEAGAGAAGAIASGILAGGGAVTSAVQSIAQTAVSAFASGGWSSIGSDMMAGIASGIRAAGAEVVSAINQVASEAESAVKEYYAISSPSGLMRDEVGVMISRGIAEGILSGAGFVRSAMETVGGQADRLRSRGDGSGGSRAVTQNIYLRDSDASPYKTARRIRRESEAVFRN